MKTYWVLRVLAAAIIVASILLFVWTIRGDGFVKVELVGLVLAIVGILLAIFIWWRSEHLRQADSSRSIDEAYAAVIEPLPSLLPLELQRSTQPSALLSAERRVMPFRFNRKKVDEIQAWCVDSGSPRFFIVDGPAQSGKSRLWVELVHRGVGRGWKVGRLRRGREKYAFDQLSKTRGRHLVIVETTDAGEGLAGFLADVATAPAAASWRILLICRARSALPALSNVAAQSVLDAAKTLSGGRLGIIGGAADQARCREQAAAAYASVLVTSAAPHTIVNRNMTYPIGVVVANGLIDALNVSSAHTDVFNRVAELELSRWPSQTRESGDPNVPGSSAVRSLFALMWLFGATEPKQVASAMAHIRSGLPYDFAKTADELLKIYPGPDGLLNAPTDAISAAISIPELTFELQIDLVVESLSSQSPLIRSAAIGRLLAASTQLPYASTLADAVLTAAEASIDAASFAFIGGFVDASGDHDRLLAAMIAAHPPRNAEECGALAGELYKAGMISASDQAAGIAISAYRLLADEDHVLYDAKLARSLADRSTRLYEMGRSSHEIVEVDREVVRLYRHLVVGGNTHDVLNLGVALSRSSLNLIALGVDDATTTLHLSGEAVELFRAHVPLVRTTDRRNFAGVLLGHSKSLAGCGDMRAASAISDEAVQQYRDLAELDETLFGLDLAVCLTHHSTLLVDVGGHSKEAVELSLEAINLLKASPMRDQRRYEMYLPSAIVGYAIALSAEGRALDQAAAASKESVDMYRRLSIRSPGLYERGLARALNNCASFLAMKGRDIFEAIEMSRESVAIFRRLSVVDRAPHETSYAGVLTTYAMCLSKTGRHSESAEASLEAVNIFQRLVEQRGEGFYPDLAGSLSNYSNALSNLETDRKQAVEASGEALRIFRLLAGQNPARYALDHIKSLATYSQRLVEAGKPELALAPAEIALKKATHSNATTDESRREIPSLRQRVVEILIMLGREDESETVRLGLSWRSSAQDDPDEFYS